MRYLLPFVFLLLAACESSPHYPNRAVLNWRSQDSWDSTVVAEAAKAELVMLPMSRLFYPDGQAKLDKIVALNPNVKFIGSLVVLGVPQLWHDTTYVKRQLPFEWDYYNVVRPDWAYTSTLDTLSIWPGIVFLNPIRNGQVNTQLIHAIVRLVKSYADRPGAKLDGIFHDYLMSSVYRSPAMVNVVGETDLNYDGIPIGLDMEERTLLRRYQLAYLDSFRAVFGDDFIQIANGSPPQDDMDYASRVNGIFFEQFPTQSGKYTPKKGFTKMLATQKDGWLREARGRTWSILYNQYAATPNVPLVASLLAGCFYAEPYLSQTIFHDFTLEPHVGNAQGYMTVSTSGGLWLERVFNYGTARVSFDGTSEYMSECVFDSVQGRSE